MGEGSLQSRIVAVPDITKTDRRRMYAIFARHYDCVSLDGFSSDLAEKDCALVLTSDNGTIRGFSTQKVLQLTVSGVPIRAVFSGDTVVDRAYWGEQELGRCWCRYVSSVYWEDPDVPLYWFLVSKGYRTYLYLPLFFERFYPNWDAPTPEFEQFALDSLAGVKVSNDYCRKRGVVEFAHSKGQLKPHLAEIPARRLRDRHVQFFLQRNPGYGIGHELACLAKISPHNMKLFAGRILAEARIGETISQGAD